MARRTTAALIATALLAGLAAAAWSVGSPERIASIARPAARALAADLRWRAAAGYRRRPVVMIGLAGALVLPPLALVGFLLLRRRRLAPAAPIAHLPGDADARIAVQAPAWLEIEGAGPRRRLPARDLIQIGREDDNDVCLSDASVHRYHAVIERSPDLGFVITDVSGPRGSGVRVNGTRLSSASLDDGDTVELGRARLRFATAA